MKRKERKKMKKHRDKYGYLLNEMHEDLREKNIRMWVSDDGLLLSYRMKEYCSYEDATYCKYFDDIDYISFQHYVLGKDMTYPPKLGGLHWTFRGQAWIDGGIKHTIEVCEATDDIYELPILPDTITRLYIDCINLKPIKTLPNILTTLEIEQTNLKYLPDLPETLKYLICALNNLVELPKLPNKLEELNCYSNNLTYLPELPKSISRVICSGNLIKKMPDSIVNMERQSYIDKSKLNDCFIWKKTTADFMDKYCNLSFIKLLKYQKAVEVIENLYLEAKYNPEYQFCKKRLKREYEDMYQEE